jgi:hypothetical protein
MKEKIKQVLAKRKVAVLAAVAALTLGTASTAMAANGGNFILGSLSNAATAITKLTGNVAGPSLQIANLNTGAGARALDLSVASGKPPLTVNATAGKATNLNADNLDGKSANEIGVNGVQRVVSGSRFDSESPKQAIVYCPAGKVAVGTGGSVDGGKRGGFPNAQTDIVVQDIFPSENGSYVSAQAYEEDPTSANWSVYAIAICATAP